MKKIIVKRKKTTFLPDNSRVITKFIFPATEDRTRRVISRVLQLPEEEVKAAYDKLNSDFSERHHHAEDAFKKHYLEVEKFIPNPGKLSEERKMLIGTYFTQEFSIQSAAFFNPSIVEHPDHLNLKKDSKRFILSFRSVGEGHISSIEFRSGILDANNRISLDTVSGYVEVPTIKPDAKFDKYVFKLKLAEMEHDNNIANRIFDKLSDFFNFSELKNAIHDVKKEMKSTPFLIQTADMVFWIAKSNDEQQFRAETELSERVIFPVLDIESNGLEDARFVKFVEDDGKVKYYATFTAYNGTNILPMLMSTHDFVKFRHLTLNGKLVKDKGMALFPRKINGKYVMISRVDGENTFIMYSDNIHFWNEGRMLFGPKYAWEFLQVGNCGSPVETEKGWLLLTHGVGPMRTYYIGALLLDLEDPSKIIGRLSKPLIKANQIEREGYVPNVVYTCGYMINANDLVIPYAVSDLSSTFATVALDEIFNAME